MRPAIICAATGAPATASLQDYAIDDDFLLAAHADAIAIRIILMPMPLPARRKAIKCLPHGHDDVDASSPTRSKYGRTARYASGKRDFWPPRWLPRYRDIHDYKTMSDD